MLSAGQHTLTTQADSEDSSKICILVKLTDSSVKAIEEYLKNKNNSKKPSIQFVQKDKGEITLPIEQKSDNDSSGGYQLKKFLFGLSSVKESNKDTSASSECISYNGFKLKTIATIEQKLNVQANDEVFLATKEKVNSVVEEEKKNSTIEIKPSGAIVNRNSSNYGSSLANINMKQAKQGGAAQIVTKNNISNADASKQRPPVLDRPLRERLIHLLAIKSFNRAEILLKLNKDAPLSDRDKDNIDSILQSIAVLNTSKNSYDLTTEVMLNEVKDDWPFYSQSEKSYAKKRIALKQQQQQQQQQLSLNQSLNSSSSLAPSTSSTPSNAAHKQSNFPNRPSTSGSSSSSSAFVSIKQQQNTSASMNKSLASNLTNSFEASFNELNSSIDVTKKISPLKTENFKPAVKTSPSSSSFQMAASKHAHQQQMKNQNQSSKMAVADSLKVSPDYDDDETTHSNSNSNWPVHNTKKQTNEKENESEGAKKKLKPDVATKDRLNDIETNELNECARKYKKIQSKQQKDQYVSEFDKFYNEYVELHQYFETLSKKYNKFKQELDMIKKDDSSQDSYNEKKLKIVQDYLSRQADAEYVKKRDRYSQVYVKLKYIEDLCKEYDNSDNNYH